MSAINKSEKYKKRFNTDNNSDEEENIKPKIVLASGTIMYTTNGSKNVNKKFKLPFENKKSNLNGSSSSDLEKNDQLIENKQSIIDEINKIDHEIFKITNEGLQVENIYDIISKLHLYNEIKDIAQMLLEKLAHLKCLSIKEMHEIYNLDPENN